MTYTREDNPSELQQLARNYFVAVGAIKFQLGYIPHLIATSPQLQFACDSMIDACGSELQRLAFEYEQAKLAYFVRNPDAWHKYNKQRGYKQTHADNKWRKQGEQNGCVN